MAAGQCGNFIIDFDLSCEAELGQTHCTEARIYPDTLCPQNANWSGANIEVEGNCVNDEVHLTIKNTGTGDMVAPLDYIVVEDVLMFDQGNFNLGAGQTMQLPPIAANGATWRLEAEQVPEHPYPGSVAVALEGCDGINELGLVNLFPIENPNPFIAVDCRENQGAFDPNDKQGFPVGYGEEHFIHRNTDIEYLIRFQNMGTDTAFTVIVQDSLSQYLDPTSIRPGAASHAYSFEVIDGNTLRFTFSDIMLPDSNINLAASQGFVQFVAKQKTDVALGSVIENTAAIYFDFNEPVTTNRVFHTIDEDFIEVINDAHEPASVHGQPTVYPNPAFGAVTFALPVELGDNASFMLHDQMGKLARKQAVSDSKFVFERKDMLPGIYFYSIESEGVKLFSGKVVLK
ncbi:MAG: T9SS type A sorting domain-containing protein [Saprospiraceae bacterium]|nr:T9SS type A sorting domain-containing protein [Saprospiraceae bacterium]